MSGPQLEPLASWTRDYVLSLPRSEFDWLDFKRSAWLSLDSECLDKLSCYVSAWANYEGGYLIIGIENPTESGQLEVDEGVDLKAKGNLKSWLEDKVPTLVDEPLERVGVHTIPAETSSDRGMVIIHIPASSAAPHQARDGKFYTRLGSKLHPLPRRAIFDIANRRKHPRVVSSLLVNLFNPDVRDRGSLIWEARNESNVFCRHVGAIIQLPVKFKRAFLFFKDGLLESDSENGSFWVVSAGNGIGQPLFPRSSLKRKVKAQLVPKITDKSGEVLDRTIGSIKVRTFADGAPYLDQEFSPDEVIHIRSPDW
jgi:Schlafen, AlbA_2